MILQRKKLRVQYIDCCQKIIRINYKIKEIQLCKGDKYLSISLDYAKYLKELDSLSQEKIILKRGIDNLVINSDMDKLGELEGKFRENLTSINSNLNKLWEAGMKIKKIKKNQNQLMENIDDCLKITAN